MNSCSVNRAEKKPLIEIKNNDSSFSQNAIFLEYLWKQFLILFEQEKDKKIINTWLTTLELIAWYPHQKILEISLPNKFVKQWIEQNILSIMKKIFARLLQEESIQIEFIFSKKSTLTEHKNQTQKTHISPQTISNYQFIPGTALNNNKNKSSLTSYCDALYTKENFLITESNKEVISAIQYYIEKNNLWTAILFIHGQTGIGKTHLLFAIKHLLVEKNITVLYLNAEDFLKKYIHAAKSKTIYKLEKEFKDITILLFDDFEYLVDKPHTQEFFMQIIKDFTENGKKIILTAKNNVNEMTGITPVLLHKLDTALTFQYKQSSLEDIRNILTLKIKSYNYDFPPEFIDHIINVKGISIQQAESMIHKIIAQSIISQKKISLDIIFDNIAATTIKKKITPPTIDDIITKIEEHCQVSLFDMIFKKNKEAVKYRYAVIYIARKIYHLPCNNIAQYFKYKDHTTISYACSIYKNQYYQEENMQKLIQLFTHV